MVNCFRKGGFRLVMASEEDTESEDAVLLEAEEEPVLPMKAMFTLTTIFRPSMIRIPLRMTSLRQC